MSSSISTPRVAKMTRRQIASLVVLSAAVALVAIDGTVLSIAIPALEQELAPSYTQVLWIGDIYAFVLAGLLVTMGNLGDRFGRKRVLLLAATGFGIVSLGAALAPSAEWLILMRALQGLAGAGLMPPTLALIRTIFTDDRLRTRAIGIWSAAGAAGASIGPTVAGLLVEHYYWGSVMLINLPIVAFIVVVGFLVLPESRGDAKAPIDVLSVLLSVVGIISVTYGITETAYEGLATRPLLFLLAGVLVLYLFWLRQTKIAHPLLDFSLFRLPAFTGAVFAQLFVVLAVTGSLFFLSIYLQKVSGLSPVQAGVALIPVSIASMLMAPNTGRFIRRFGPAKVLLVGLSLGGLGLVTVGILEGGSYWPLIPGLILLGISFGSVLTTCSELVLSSAPAQRAGAAVGISETFFELGGALGIALLGSTVSVLYQIFAGSASADLADTDSYSQALGVTISSVGAVLLVAAVVIFKTVRRSSAKEITQSSPTP